MTYVHHKMSNGTLRDIVREDAIQMRDPSRHYCPTTEATKYVDTWEDAKAAGMEVCFNEDQTRSTFASRRPTSSASGSSGSAEKDIETA